MAVVVVVVVVDVVVVVLVVVVVVVVVVEIDLLEKASSSSTHHVDPCWCTYPEFNYFQPVENVLAHFRFELKVFIRVHSFLGQIKN